jgi:hypothetical protein
MIPHPTGKVHEIFAEWAFGGVRPTSVTAKHNLAAPLDFSAKSMICCAFKELSRHRNTLTTRYRQSLHNFTQCRPLEPSTATRATPAPQR